MSLQILDALRRGANEEAVALARTALAENPDKVDVQRAAALAFRAIGDTEAAVTAIDAAIALVPDDANLHFLRAGMLLDARQLAAAQAALSQTVSLDPNQFGAYVMQAQMAIGRNDLDEAERLSKLAARVSEDHPWTLMLQGSLASRRGDHDRALALLAAASKRAPDDLQVLNALAFAYLAKDHLAFAEQTFRRVIEKTGYTPLRGLLAQIVLRQGRPDDAADEVAALLADPEQASPGWQVLGGELELQAGRPERARPLLMAAFQAHPDSARATNALLQFWHATNAADEARSTLDAAIDTNPAFDHLWLARLAVEPFGGDAARAIIERWIRTRPDHLPALQAQLALHTGTGDGDSAEATARTIAALQPGHGLANELIFNRLVARDPDAAIGFAEGLLEAASPQGRLLLRRWIGIAQDLAGRPDAAIETWLAVDVESTAAAGLPPTPTTAPAQWPELAQIDPTRAPAAFLYGAPGAQVDRLAAVLQAAVPGFRGDRFRQPLQDAFQDTTVPTRLAAGEFTGKQVADSWLAQLPARGIASGAAVIDWLPFWDNAWLLALRPHLPHLRLLFAIRDPRDMLLDWLAFGTPLAMRIEDADSAASWLAAHLEQIAELSAQNLLGHALIRLDAPADNTEDLAKALAVGLGTSAFPVPPRDVLGADRLPAGRWRAYRDVLSSAFASLQPVAVRLGYPQD